MTVLTRHLPLSIRPFCLWLGATAFAFIVAGCGGVDSGGTGATPAVASGPITGFGSIIVGGVHYDDSTAIILDGDGTARARSDLKLGMTTEIVSTSIVTDANALSSGTAKSIVYSSAVVGPVTSVDTGAGSLVVLGQTITVKPTTAFDDSLTGGLASLTVGDVVEAYALAGSATQGFTATRIERKANAVAYVLRAIVANVNATAKTFDLGGLAVSYTNLAAGSAVTTPVNGQMLRVQLALAPVAGVWPATRMQNAALQLQDRDEARIEGLITAFTSSAQFSVNGVAVDASTAQFPDGTAGLALGVRVRVEGTARGQVLVATKVDIKSESESENEFELDGLIDSLDTTALRFVVRGVAVDYSGTVEYRDGTVADLATGRRVEVKGSLTDGGTRLLAERIRFR